MMSDVVKFFKDVSGITRYEKEEVRQLREQRKETIEVLGGPPLERATAFDPVFELAMEEAQIRGHDYDLCVVPERTYKSLHDVPATVPTPGEHYGKLPDVISSYDLARMHDMSPPVRYSAGNYSIQMTYSDEIERTIFLDTSKL